MSAEPAAPARRTHTWRRHRWNLLVGAGLLLAVVVVAFSQSSTRSGVPLDPENADPDGARAVARVLADEGVEVLIARGAEALEQHPVDEGTVVLVTSSAQLGPSTIDRLLAHSTRGRLVVADPENAVTDALGVDAQSVQVAMTEPAAADCGPRAFADLELAGLEVHVDQARAFALPGCFGLPDGRLLAQAPPTADRGELTLLGAGALLSNEQVLRADNAAVALRLLGSGERLVWYLPDARDLAGQQGLDLRELLPPWLVPGLWLLGVAMLAVVLLRARRLGPLAVEPLPVVVKAVEATTSRGRLYRRAGDREHAAAALRAATAHRLAAALRLPAPAGADLAELVVAVSRHCDLAPGPVSALLTGPAPVTDEELVHLANDLAALEEEVRRR